MRLRNGLTPPQLADEVLGKRIEKLGEMPERSKPESPLELELRLTRRLMRLAVVLAAAESVLSLVVIGLRLAGQ